MIDGYPLSPFMIKTVKVCPGNDYRDHQEFNNKLSKNRVLIENVIGRLKNKFPMLRHDIRVALDFVPKIIVACCVLYNIGKDILGENEDMELEKDIEDFVLTQHPSPAQHPPSNVNFIKINGI